MLNFDPERPTTPPSNATTVLVVREAAEGIEIYCVKRHQKSGFLGGAVVFPGGKLSAGDADTQFERWTTPLSPRAQGLAETVSFARALAVAAIRELFEEAAILPLSNRTLSHAETLQLRDELTELTKTQSDSEAFLQLLQKHRLTIDTARLSAMARWLTPRAESRRYDTRFYVLALTEQQAGRHDAKETTQGFWTTPKALLDRWQCGQVFLAPPTSHSLELLASAQNPDEAMSIAESQSLDVICPHFCQDGSVAVLALPGDLLFPEPGSKPIWSNGPTRFELHSERFLPKRKPRS